VAGAILNPFHEAPPMPDIDPLNHERLLRMSEVMRFGGFKGTSTLYDAMDKHGFPRPIRLGQRSKAWVWHELLAWREQRIAERDARAAAPRRPQRRRRKVAS
jgi:prophage regulatory protein